MRGSVRGSGAVVLDRDDLSHGAGGARPVEVGIRVVGVGVMVFGLVCVYLVIRTAWGLFDDQALVTRMSQEIESASGMGEYADRTLGQLMDMGRVALIARGDSAGSAPTASSSGADLTTSGESGNKRPYSYVFAWIVVVILLALISRIGLNAVSHGAKLATFQVRAPSKPKGR